MPDDLDGINACISPGVATNVGFDLAMAERGMDVYMADGSVSGPPIRHDHFHFTRKYLDTYNSSDSVTIDDFCRSVAGTGDLILQMDIEGAEYRVLTSASEQLMNRFRIMVVEFHDLESLWCPMAFREMRATFDKILQTHHVTHIHPNNAQTWIRRGDLGIPRLLEFTFHRKDRVILETGTSQFPHPLDFDNFPSLAPVVLPECWRR
jgi:hypothetical protein